MVAYEKDTKRLHWELDARVREINATVERIRVRIDETDARLDKTNARMEERINELKFLIFCGGGCLLIIMIILFILLIYIKLYPAVSNKEEL